MPDLPVLGTPRNFEEIEHSYAALQVWVDQLNSSFEALTAQVAGAGRTIFSGTLATATTGLSTGDAGFIYYVTDYNHWVRWTGTAWVFADDGNDYFADHRAAPSTGWALCDGSTVTRMVVGATLTTTTFVTPNLSGSPAYKKSGAAYAAITAASGTSGNNNPGTDSQGAHTHTLTTGAPSATLLICQDNVTFRAGDETHTHSGTSSSDGSHSHTVDNHAHSVGSIDMARLTVLPYYRL